MGTRSLGCKVGLSSGFRLLRFASSESPVNQKTGENLRLHRDLNCFFGAYEANSPFFKPVLVKGLYFL